ncbi:hypothetical protein Tco_1053218 [Tanacetum coccineum]
MKDEVNVAFQLKSNKLREEAQEKNQDLLNSIDSNMKKIIKEQSLFQEDMMMKTRMKNPLLDQTEGQREGDQARKLSLPKNQLIRRAEQQALPKDHPESRVHYRRRRRISLEYHLEEVFKATNDQLDWHNPEGRPYPHDFSKPLPLIPDARDKIPRSTWSEVQVIYDKYAYRGPKHQRFYGYATNLETSKDVYSKHRIIVVTSLKIIEFFGYKHLEEITVRRQDDVLYKF